MSILTSIKCVLQDLFKINSITPTKRGKEYVSQKNIEHLNSHQMENLGINLSNGLTFECSKFITFLRGKVKF